MNPPSTPLVLVHGAWFGAWCWRPVAQLLDAGGRLIAAVDLSGRPGNPFPIGEVTLESFVRHTLGVLHRYDRPAVLVGHSLGGVTITQVAEADPDAVSALVFVSAFLLRDGEAARDILHRDPGSVAAAARTLSADGSSSTVVPGMVREALCADCSDAEVAATRERLVAETVEIARTPVHWTPGRFGSVPRAFIECSNDRIISLSAQREMLSAVGCDHVLTLDTSHSPFLAAPERLATAILTCADSIETGLVTMSDFEPWVGRREEREELISQTPIRLMAATLDLEPPDPGPGGVVPLLWH